MKEPRHDHASLVLEGGIVFIFGGIFLAQRRSYERLRLQMDNRWRPIQLPQPLGRAPFSLLPIKGRRMVLFGMKRERLRVLSAEGHVEEEGSLTRTEIDWGALAFKTVRGFLWVSNVYNEPAAFCEYSSSFHPQRLSRPS